jgi:S1-C subfamily serine protease
MPDIPDNVPIYVSSDYGDDEQSHERGSSRGAPLDRDHLMNDRPAKGWAAFTPGAGKPPAAADEDAANEVPTTGPRIKTDEQLAQSGFQSFRIPHDREESDKVFALSPGIAMILVGITSVNFLMLGIWLGAVFIPHEPVVSSTRPGVESLFGLTKGKGKAMTDPSNLVAEAVAKASPSVVNIDMKFNRVQGQINSLNENGSMPSGEATGLIIRSDGYIVTNAHVVSAPGGLSKIKVTLIDGKSYEAKIIGFDDFSDIAVIKIDAKDLPVVKFGSSLDVHPGDWAIAIGSPLGFDHTVSLGVVSAINRSLSFFNNHVRLIQHDAALNFGNSGGPLLNIRGEVIGINTAVKEKAQGIGFATPVDVVSDVVEQLIAHGSIPRPFLGVYMNDIDPDRSRSQTLPSHPVAVQVSGVVADGPALRAGVSAGDTIVKVNGQDVHSTREVREVIFTCKPGETIDFVVKRNGALTTCKVTLGDSSKLNVPH